MLNFIAIDLQVLQDIHDYTSLIFGGHSVEQISEKYETKAVFVSRPAALWSTW